ncbi:zinc-alpha-2-glycoprotein isoform X15 [Carassius gibelio]|uniref:zinc-alpha-2-glycoprotein isoform X11 n=1 Tax=Carassius gibelio TaxID=101364 RepID=UPI0022787E12|nr:zinc-alpha-2-glycoprotein isoform X11 [Carassius gibelio]XP_052407035.1 zinc-alpha-2-glycoprotein isoform X12 [Carassius gibelio]XP_052407036.1 zinc-alpha-2-glycoprotein isoform X13 [Carassius gibelio]XP_052407037.1 zinc-alpha-2-glycoprotein isoform X14 [Carassius gibelio]XP_052407038.1 zinc-alpha-2-glycoprotein isoform X15 [Carassius gibelio]
MAFKQCGRVAKLFALLCVFLLYRTLPSIQAEKHSLYYIYTGLSKPVDLPGIYEFTAMGLLDDTQIDYYNSEEQRNIAKQTWMKEKLPEDYWEEDTQFTKSKEQWIRLNIFSLMKCMKQNESDLHVLQWRHGCEVEQGYEPKRINEYCYDGEDFLSYDYQEAQWVAPVDTNLISKWKWENVPILNQHTADYLKMECEVWLKRFRQYADEELRKASLPDVHMFARKSRNETQLKLICMASSFYAKDMMMTIRKYRTPLPEITSTEIRPNPDGTFQIQKSVEINEDEEAEYDCFVTHKSMEEPIIKKWDGNCLDCPTDTFIALIGAGIVVSVLLPIVLVFYIKHKKCLNGSTGPIYTMAPQTPGTSLSLNEQTPGTTLTLNEQTPGTTLTLNEQTPGTTLTLNEQTPGTTLTLNEQTPGTTLTLNEQTPGTTLTLNEQTPGTTLTLNEQTPDQDTDSETPDSSDASSVERISPQGEASSDDKSIVFSIQGRCWPNGCPKKDCIVVPTFHKHDDGEKTSNIVGKIESF